MPIATITTARDTVMTHWKTNWDVDGAAYSAFPIMYDDTKVDRPVDGGYLAVTIKHNPSPGSSQVSMGSTGNRKFERLGLVIVQVFTPFGDGQTKADLIAEIVRGIFEGKKTSLGGVWFRNVSIREIGVVDGFWQVNVTIAFEYETLK